MDYQELIEAAYEMTSDDRIRDALEDGELLGAKRDIWQDMSPAEIIDDIKNELESCVACGNLVNGEDNPDAIDQKLCDRCFREFNRYDSDGFIGYRKGE